MLLRWREGLVKAGLVAAWGVRYTVPMALPLAYFLSWTCYGTRLHGDERGSVDSTCNRLGAPLLEPDEDRVRLVTSKMTGPARTLDDDARAIVDRAIRAHCEVRGRSVLALNVRTTHVHVVLDCRGTHGPEAAMAQLKSWATRRLRAAGLFEPGRRVWTDHGSTRWINFEEGLRGAVRYVLFEQ